MSRSQVSFEEPGISPQQAAKSLELDGGQDGYFGGEPDEPNPFTARAQRRASLSIRIPPARATADMAFMALQYLPHPILVLSSSKTIVLANEAMGRLLGIDISQGDGGKSAGEDGCPEESTDFKSATDILYGVTVAQLGLDLLQAGNPVFVAWDDFLECLVDDASRGQCSTTYLNTYHRGLDKQTTPTANNHRRTTSHASSGFGHPKGSKTEVHDAMVDVVFSTTRDGKNGLPLASRHDETSHVQAQMIVSVWATDEDLFFTLTFTASGQAGSKPFEGAKTTSRTVSRHSASLRSGMGSESSSNSSGQQKSNHTTSTPTSITSYVTSPRSTDFLPNGPPGKSLASAPTMFSKTNRLKDAILNTMNIPAYAMWKDETFGVPNKAAIKLIYPVSRKGKRIANGVHRCFR